MVQAERRWRNTSAPIARAAGSWPASSSSERKSGTAAAAYRWRAPRLADIHWRMSQQRRQKEEMERAELALIAAPDRAASVSGRAEFTIGL